MVEIFVGGIQRVVDLEGPATFAERARNGEVALYVCIASRIQSVTRSAVTLPVNADAKSGAANANHAHRRVGVVAKSINTKMSSADDSFTEVTPALAIDARGACDIRFHVEFRFQRGSDSDANIGAIIEDLRVAQCGRTGEFRQLVCRSTAPDRAASASDRNAIDRAIGLHRLDGTGAAGTI